VPDPTASDSTTTINTVATAALHVATANILSEYRDVFPSDLPAQLPPKRDVDFKIEVFPDTSPPSRPTYRMSPSELDELKKQLEDLTKHGFIRPSTSSYGSPVLFVKTKDGSI